MTNFNRLGVTLLLASSMTTSSTAALFIDLSNFGITDIDGDGDTTTDLIEGLITNASSSTSTYIDSNGVTGI